MAVPSVKAFDPALGRRLLSAAVLAPPVILAVVVGTPLFEIATVFLALQLAREWARLVNDGRHGPAGIVLVVLAAGAVAVAGVSLWAGLLIAVAGSPVVAAVAAATRHPHPAWLAAGLPYIAGPTVALLWLRVGDVDGLVTTLWLLLAIWATDSLAYLAGRSIGGPKLLPRVSPNKTWSGLAGGVLGAALAGAAISAAAGAPAPWLPALVAAMLALAAQGGDLAESAVKRRFRVKDAGRLIPGHGGLLDRVDGLLAATPLLALAVWLAGSGPMAWT